MQRVSMQLVAELEKKDHITLHEETINVSGKGKVAIGTAIFLLKQLAGLPVKAQETEADVILFSSMVTASLAYFIRNRVSIPMVTINHGRDVTLPVEIYQWFLPKIFASLDGVISVSRATREECIKRGMEREKGVALPNGFDMTRLQYYPGKQQARQVLINEFGMAIEDRKMLLTVGRQVQRKGHEWFIRNVLPLIESEVVYAMIGDGPEEENIAKATRESDSSEYIFQLGRQPDRILNLAYAASDLFVMPNIPVEGDMEGFGIVLLEANMAKTPAVASDLEGIKDVIENGKNGFRVPHNAAMFAGKVDEVLNGDLETFSEQTREYVQNRFSWQNVSNHYLDFLKQVTEDYKKNKIAY